MQDFLTNVRPELRQNVPETGRYLMAVGYDATGSYQIPLACGFAALVLAVAATLLLGKYPKFAATS